MYGDDDKKPPPPPDDPDHDDEPTANSPIGPCYLPLGSPGSFIDYACNWQYDPGDIPCKFTTDAANNHGYSCTLKNDSGKNYNKFFTKQQPIDEFGITVFCGPLQNGQAICEGGWFRSPKYGWDKVAAK